MIDQIFIAIFLLELVFRLLAWGGVLALGEARRTRRSASFSSFGRLDCLVEFLHIPFHLAKCHLGFLVDGVEFFKEWVTFLPPLCLELEQLPCCPDPFAVWSQDVANAFDACLVVIGCVAWPFCFAFSHCESISSEPGWRATKARAHFVLTWWMWCERFTHLGGSFT